MSSTTKNVDKDNNPSFISSLVDTLTSAKETWAQSPLLSVTQLTPSGKQTTRENIFGFYSEIVMKIIW